MPAGITTSGTSASSVSTSMARSGTRSRWVARLPPTPRWAKSLAPPLPSMRSPRPSRASSMCTCSSAPATRNPSCRRCAASASSPSGSVSMRSLIRGRAVVDDAWRYPGESGDGPQVLTLAEFLAQAAGGGSAALGVQIEPADAVEALAPHIARLALVVVHFPKDGEGRGFTQGQLLRQRYGFRGEL